MTCGHVVFRTILPQKNGLRNRDLNLCRKACFIPIASKKNFHRMNTDVKKRLDNKKRK